MSKIKNFLGEVTGITNGQRLVIIGSLVGLYFINIKYNKDKTEAEIENYNVKCKNEELSYENEVLKAENKQLREIVYDDKE